MDRPATTGDVEQRTVDVEIEGVRAEGQTLRGHAAVFDVLSEDLGGFRERIAPGAFRDVLDDDVRLLVDHEPPPLARTKAGTLRLHEDERGLAFEADLPNTSHARDLRESVARGDVDGASFRFVVGEETWQGDIRTIARVAQLRDVSIACFPAYDATSIELRSKTTTGGERRQKGANMDPQETGAETAETTETETTETATEAPATEQRSEQPAPAGGLRVEQRTSPARRRSLAEEFRATGFPGESATIPWRTFEESRSVTWTPSIDLLSQLDRQGGPAPYDQRYAWSAFERVAVDDDVTSVQVLVHMGSTAATGVVRTIDATSDKAEVESTVTLSTVPLSGVAAVSTGIPNVVLAQPSIDSIIQTDLQMAVNEGLDGLVVSTFAASDNQAPGSDPLPTSIRKSLTVLQGSGYAPDTVILTPADAQAIDVLVSGVSGATADYVYGPGNFATDIYGLRRIVSKSIPATTVLDSRAFAKVYASPVRLAVFEENDGRTNTSLVRLELHAACAAERQDAAVRIAAS